MLFPQKNLIPDFNDSRWFSDVSAAGGTMVVDPKNPHKMSLTLTASAQGRLVQIPVELGKTYTFSFKNITGLYRLYKRRVGNHDAPMNLIQDSNPGKPDTFTFTVDSDYQGYVTIRLTHSATGTFNFENLQLEEGLIKTGFEPYKLGNKKPVMPSEKINSDMTGASSHVYPYGNVISVKEDVRLWGYQIQVGTPLGTFDSVIYEWNNGAIGQPLFREVINATASGVMNLSFKGTLLKAGKKYYIGRNDPNRDNSSLGNAGVYRKTSMPGADFKYITTLGGSQFYSPAIDFPSTWYYTFGLEITPAKLTPSLVPKKNLIPPLTDPSWVLNPYVKVLGDYSMTMENVTSSQWVSIDIPIQVGKTYIFSHDSNLGMYTDIRSGSGYHPKVQDGAPPNVPVKVTHPDAKFMRVAYNVTNSSPNFMKNMQLEEGSVKTPFEPYKLINPKPELYPTINLIDPTLSKWRQGSLDSAGNLTGGSTRLVFIERIKMNPNAKYTIKVKNGYRVFMRHFSDQTVEISNSGWLTDGATFTTPSNIKTTMVLIARGDDSGLNVEEVSVAAPMLAQGDFNQNIPYNPSNKPAVMYPGKNLLNDDIKLFKKQYEGTTIAKENGYFTVLHNGTAYADSDVIRLTKGVTYTLSFIAKSDGVSLGKVAITNANDRLTWLGGASSDVAETNDKALNLIYTPTNDIDVVIRFYTGRNGTSGKMFYKDFQLEEGSKTPFEPYKGRNKKL